ncbi:MAG TPA: TonB-dependent receptor [Dinghuibacter sp.]|uniref:TonB-dependent receptor n=1 Tax=Dinghuibacter sp. TaxID=2024697 RepID=UPI002B8BE46D|nr:TonB-dependent receptor [Dinghuibacter sp.]HTJ12442.1 TonB-dependent receptor [Dinghuibacter sp.]
MHKILLLILLAFCLCTAGVAQTNPVNPANAPMAGGPIHGIVKDSTSNRPLEKASVFYVEAGKTDTTRTLTDAQGNFSFDKAPSGEFILIISFIGHQSKGVQYPANMAGDVGVIEMSPKIKELEGIVIQAPPIKVMQDTVEYRANAYPVRKDAVAEDLLKKLPGVEVDAQGNVTAHGQTVTKIRVNGKDFFGGDPKMATKNIPADAIDKIQVIDDQSDQAKFSGFDDGDRTKIINITIRKDRNQGYFGSGTAGVGLESKSNSTLGNQNAGSQQVGTPYEAYLRGFRFNNAEQIAVLANANNVNVSNFTQGGASFQGGGGRGGGGGGGGTTSPSANLTQSNSGATGYNDAKTAGFHYANDITPHFTIFGSYQFTQTNSTSETNTFTQQPGSQTQPYSYAQTHSVTDQIKHSVMLNIGWGITPHDSLLFRGQFNYTSNKQDNNSNTAYENAEKDTTYQVGQHYQGKNSSPATNATLLWMHRFNKVGRTLSVTLTDNPSPSTETDSNYSVQSENGISPILDTIHQVSFFKTNNYSYSGRASYTEPLGLKSGLELSYAYSSSENVSSKNVYALDPKLAETFVDSLSNNIDNTLITNKVGLTFRHKERKFNYQVGASLQPTLLDTKTVFDDTLRHYVQREMVFVPIGSLAYQFSQTKRLRIFYTGTSQQPTPTQLEPVPDYTNPLRVNLGNPDLKPEFDNHFIVNYNNFSNLTGRSFFFNLNTNIVSHNIATNTIQDTGKVIYYKPVNANGYYTASGNVNFSQPFHNRMFVLTVGAKTGYTHDPEYFNDTVNLGQTWTPTGTIRFEWDKGSWMEVIAGVAYSLNSSTYSLANSATAASATGLGNSQTSNWQFAQSARFDFLKILSFRYDFIYTLNQGYSSQIGNKPVTLINAVLESRFFSDKLIAGLQVNDLLNDNKNFSQSSNNGTIVQSQSNILQRFFMFTLTYKFAKFKGAQATGGQMMMGRGMRGDGGGGGGGGRRGGGGGNF